MKDEKDLPGGDVFGRINRLLKVANQDDDRGMVLSVASFAEEALGRLLLAYLKEGKQSADLVEGFNAPLGTLSARIKAAYSVGLLSREQYLDLENLRRIRNEFAHNWDNPSLDDPKIAAWANALHPSRIHESVRPKLDTPSKRLYSSMTGILVELEFHTGELLKQKKRVPNAWTHLSLQPPGPAP